MSSIFIVRSSLLFVVYLMCSTSCVNGIMSQHQSLVSSLFSDNHAARYSSSDSSMLSEHDVDYIRRLLLPAHDLQRTPIGNMISRPAHEAALIQTKLLDLVEMIRSFDIDSLAERIVAEDKTVKALMSSLQVVLMEEQRINGGRVVDQLSPSTLDKVNTMIDLPVIPWIPAANLSECSQAYSQFVDPITNRIWNIVRSSICESLGLGDAACDRVLDPVPVVTQPSWGRRMIDAMGKIPEGIADGKLHFVGAFDMCNTFKIENVSISLPNSSVEQIHFNGQYCRLSIQPSFSDLSNLTGGEPLPLGLQLGVCTPEICSKEQVHHYITRDNKMLAIILSLIDNATIPTVYCGQEVDGANDVPFQVGVAIMLICVILIIIATIYDGCFRKWRLKRYMKKLPKIKRRNRTKESTSESDKSSAPVVSDMSSNSNGSDDVGAKVDYDEGRISSYEVLEQVQVRRLGVLHRLELLLIGFSAYTNLRKMFTSHSKPGDIPVLNGVRYLSYVWVVLGQTYFLGPVYHESFVTANTLTFLRTYPHQFKMQVVINFNITGDSFLLISGILVTYWFLKRFEASGRRLRIITIVIYAVRRYWRVMPGLMGTLMFYTTTYRYLADGPLFPTDIGDGDNCRLNWWVDLLMVQNLVRTEYLCLSWLFLVPIILQLQLAALVVLIPLVLKPVIGYVMVAVMWVAHIITTAILSNDYRNNSFSDWPTGYLFTPWCRAGPFCVGLALGIILYEKRKVKMHWAIVLLGWIVALCTMGAVVFSSYSEFKEGGERWSPAALTAYDTLARSAWGVAVGWVIFACHYGYGGVINTFLSWKLFLPLSRLVYASLLTHAIMIFRYIYANRQLFYIEEYNMLCQILSNIVYTLLMGVVFGLLFHYPLSMGIERAVLSRTLVDWFRAGRHPRTVKNALEDDSIDSSPPSTGVFSVQNNDEPKKSTEKTTPPSGDVTEKTTPPSGAVTNDNAA